MCRSNRKRSIPEGYLEYQERLPPAVSYCNWHASMHGGFKVTLAQKHAMANGLQGLGMIGGQLN